MIRLCCHLAGLSLDRAAAVLGAVAKGSANKAFALSSSSSSSARNSLSTVSLSEQRQLCHGAEKSKLALSEDHSLLTQHLQRVLTEGDDARHRRTKPHSRRAAVDPSSSSSSSSASLSLASLASHSFGGEAGGCVSMMTSPVHNAVTFAELSKRRRRLQEMQTPQPPKRRRGSTAPSGLAVSGHSTHSGGFGGLRLLQPAAVIASLRRAARNNARDEKLWKSLCSRVCLVAPGLRPFQIAAAFHAAARIRYRDERMVNSLIPLLLKQLEDFELRDLVLVLSAFKKLELHRLDTLELIVNQLCFALKNATAQDLALAANSISFFYLYHPRFWRLVLKQLPNVLSQLSPTHAVLLASSFSRIDLRDGAALLLLAKIVKKHALQLQQQEVAVAASAFSRLLFVHPKLTSALHKAVHALLEKLLLKLLNALAQRSVYAFTPHQTRRLNQVKTILRLHFTDFYKRLPPPVADLLQSLPEVTPKECGEQRSLWSASVLSRLVSMGVSFEAYKRLEGVEADVLLTKKNIAIIFAGPHKYYLNSNTLTASALLQKRILELQGVEAFFLPYSEWIEMKTPEEQQRYLWAFGRAAATELQQKEEMEAADSFAGAGEYLHSLASDGREFCLEVEEQLGDTAEEITTSTRESQSMGRRKRVNTFLNEV